MFDFNCISFFIALDQGCTELVDFYEWLVLGTISRSLVIDFYNIFGFIALENKE